MIINLLFLIPLFAIGIICSYTDLKYGKIKNKWIILGLGWVVVLYISLGLYSHFYLHQPENTSLLIKMATNGLFALVIGYILWYFKLLAAGDVKLFTLYALLLPPEFYSKAYFSHFPSLVLLINIFVPLILFLSIKALFFSFKRVVKKIQDNKGKRIFTKERLRDFVPQLLKILRTYTIFILLFVILQLAISKIMGSIGNFSQNFPSFYLFLFLFFIYRFLFRFISKNKLTGFGVAIIGGICIIYLLISNQTDFLFTILKLAFIFMVLAGSLYRLLGFYIEQKEIQKVEIQNLKEGMFPSTQELDNNLKDKLGSVGRVGLTSKQLGLIQTFFLKNPEKEIKVYKTFALAPFIFLGAVISILTRDSFISIALRTFRLFF